MIFTKYIFIWNEIQVEMKKTYDHRSVKWNLGKCKLTQKILCRIIYSY